ncbi:MAG: HAD family phosphatase [Clostridia bacterium]|nr:HAD family phosphatase [Clostridia bacterium]
MDDIRLIVMDMDGTLLTPPPVQISPKTRDALLQAHAAGIALALCSGRLPDDASVFARNAALPCHVIALNGACMLNAPLGPMVYSHHLAEEDAEQVYERLRNTPTTFAMFCDHDLYVRSLDTPPLPDLVWGTYLAYPGTRTRVFTREADALPLLRRGVSKFVCVHPRDDGVLQQLQAALSSDIPGIALTSSWKDNIEIIRRGVDKGYGIQQLCERLALSPSQVMAFGDQDNDLPMLEACGFPVAMGNAAPSVCDAARFITRSNRDDGIAWALEQLLFSASSRN